jgi:carbamoyl-phosphate synthase large subunit
VQARPDSAMSIARVRKVSEPDLAILVTGMGGNVGQGIVRCIRSAGLPVRIIGTNTVRPCGGSHLVDALYEVPHGFDDGYIEAVRLVCEREDIRLIVPSTDFETGALARHRNQLPVVAVSPMETAQAFLDKAETASVFVAKGIPFAESVIPSEYHGEFAATIVKPRMGRGSRNIFIDPPDPDSFGDDFVVQRRYEGVEITTAFYVLRNGGLHGHITMRRSLTAGMTTACEVTQDYDNAVVPIVVGMMEALTIRGSCNIQAIALADGRVIPFEVNGRLSGTASIRDQFGFEDAQWTVLEYLYNRTPNQPRIRHGSALRLMTDVIYPDRTLAEIDNAGTPHVLF